MSTLARVTTWSSNQTLTASALNGEFNAFLNWANTYAVQTDVAKTITVGHTWQATQTLTPGSGYAIDITAGGLRETAGGITGTAVTLSSQNAVTFSHASARFIPGATGVYFRNNANSADNLAITDAGAVTVRAGLTVSAGTTAMQAATCTTLVASSTVTGSGFTASGTTPKLLIGSTNMTIRDDNDAVTLATFTDSVVTVGNGVSIGAVTVGQSIGAAAYTGGNVELGNAGATTGATSQFVCIDSCAGVPSGAPSPTANMIPMRYDRTNNRIYFYNGSWRYATLT